MDRIYSFSDFEDAYYHGHWVKCIEIGKYLLSNINNDYARELLEALNEVDYSWNMSKDKAEYLTKLLSNVRIWILIHKNY